MGGGGEYVSQAAGNKCVGGVEWKFWKDVQVLWCANKIVFLFLRKLYTGADMARKWGISYSVPLLECFPTASHICSLNPEL